MAGKTNYAAGGIVVRGGARPRVAVVQRRKDERWILPRGKLKRNQQVINGARREVAEETGHRVRVRQFLGAIAYRVRGRPKVVQFWLMNASVRPSRDLTKDIMAVEWLPLAMAIRQLSYPLEKLFLNNVGRHCSIFRRASQRHYQHTYLRHWLGLSASSRHFHRCAKSKPVLSNLLHRPAARAFSARAQGGPS